MSGNSASDIITYIGVPLAVAGILPILYNFIATLITRSRVRSRLHHSGISKFETRSDFFSRVIELDLPQFRVTAVDRETPAYWERIPKSKASTIKGGTWTFLNWKRIEVGSKKQRIQHSDQIRQPQAEVELEQLILYLLDLGAVLEPKAWQVLRTNGLWTPNDHRLMSF